ncbi:ribonuclease III domain-containing protein [Ampelomyces quisqualis]|uniref:Ribonuclease III domain-containing protein n=1 Tax=Ampelomyces quisqualis TaxID=50730 RepID=A0A6A5QNK3_AMPQU|nr:ribonuclease III domain-containing protein [Ampelomyces quisqualis]
MSIKEQDVDAAAAHLEAMTGHKFTNKLICAEATQMAGPQVQIVYEGKFHSVPNNKRLAILGNAVLAKVLCTAWFESTPGHIQSATQWNTLRNSQLSNEGLAQRGYDLGVADCIIMAGGTVTKTPKMVATTLEAIIGAVLWDGGDDAAAKVIKHLGFLTHELLTVTSKASQFPYMIRQIIS